MATALVLAARPAGEPEPLTLKGEPELLTLKGRTSKGQPVELDFVDGRLQWANVRAWTRCPDMTDEVPWAPVLGAVGDFHQDGSKFRVRQVWRAPRDGRRPPGRGTIALTGELDDDSARGRLSVLWVEGDYVCRGTVRFTTG